MNPIVENQVYITEPLFMEWKNASKTEDYKKSLRNVTIFMAFLLAGGPLKNRLKQGDECAAILLY